MVETMTQPFGTRAARLPCLVSATAEGAVWDEERQLNVLADGTPWHRTIEARSCTDTNLDGQGDDVDDPYFVPAT